MKNNKVLNIIIIFFVLALGVNYFNITSTTLEKLISYGLMIYGITSVYIAYGTNKKAQLFSGSILFLSGVLFYIIYHYEFQNKDLIYLPALLFIFGSAFIILFLDNIKNTAFIVVGITLLLISIVVILLTNHVRFAAFVSSLSSILFNYYPIFLILIGMNLILNRDS